MNDHHEQIELITPSGLRVCVDEGMSELLSVLWRLGINTSFSCQGGEGVAAGTCYQCRGPTEQRTAPAYILFADLQSADRFSEIINRRTWAWHASKPSKKTPLRVHVYFPAADIRAIERAVQDALRARRPRAA